MSDDPQVPNEYAMDKYNDVKTLGGWAGSGSLRNPPVRKIIENQIAEFRALIAAREDLLKQLDENPGTEKVLDALRKIGI